MQLYCSNWIEGWNTYNLSIHPSLSVAVLRTQYNLNRDICCVQNRILKT